MNPELDRKLRYLRLSGMATALPARNQEAIHHHLAYPEFLELLVQDELATRRDRLFARRLKQAGIVESKYLENYDWSFNPQVPRGLIIDLATARFVREHGGVLLLGPPGTGKSHIATALTVAAIQAGHTALYRSAFDLAQDMAEAEATGTRKELIDHLCKVDLLVLEDLGMKRLPPTAAEDLLEIFVRRYEKGAIILTTNRPLEDWGQVLGDNAAAGAILDRFLHHAEVIRLQGRSYRMHNRRELRTKQADEALTGQTK
ncbi:MAG: ATP-binding protein [Chloroflexi bacterium]|nr:ATP-binding protein [Chloroflexota bacterium]